MRETRTAYLAEILASEHVSMSPSDRDEEEVPNFVAAKVGFAADELDVNDSSSASDLLKNVRRSEPTRAVRLLGDGISRARVVRSPCASVKRGAAPHRARARRSLEQAVDGRQAQLAKYALSRRYRERSVSGERENARGLVKISRKSC